MNHEREDERERRIAAAHNPSDPDYARWARERAADRRRARQASATLRGFPPVAAKRVPENPYAADHAVEAMTTEILAGIGITEGYSHNHVGDRSTGWITIHPVIIERAVKAARGQITIDRSGTEDTLLIADKLREYLTQVREWGRLNNHMTPEWIAGHLDNILDGRSWDSL